MREKTLFFKLDLADGKHEVQIFKKPKVKHFRLTVDREKNISLVIPSRLSESFGFNFLISKKHWLEKTLEKISVASKEKFTHFNFTNGSSVFLFGEKFALSLQVGRLYPLIQQKIILAPLGKSIFEKFLNNKLREFLHDFLFVFAQKNGFSYQKFMIKKMSSRWGSCSKQGNLNFNLKLVHFPPKTIEYVAIHELCHTRQMNHSDKFWQEVAIFCPQYQKQIKILKEN